MGALAGRPQYLESVRVMNHGETDYEFQLSIEQDGEVVQEETIDLDPQATGAVDCQWSGRGPFEVTCTLGGDRTETVQAADIQEGAGEYAQITFVATTSGELSSSGYLDDGPRCSGPPSE